MTPSERERRIKAAGDAYAEATFAKHGVGEADLDAIVAALDVADEVVPVVPATWDGLLEHLDAMYPADVFTGEGGDVGARLVALARKLVQIESENAALKRVWEADSEALQRAEAAARELWTAAMRVFDLWDETDEVTFHRAMNRLQAACQAHSSFSGEEGTEG